MRIGLKDLCKMKNYAFFGITTLILAVVICAKADDHSTPSRKIAEIHRESKLMITKTTVSIICSSTDYKQECSASLATIRSPDPRNLIRSAFDLAIVAVRSGMDKGMIDLKGRADADVHTRDALISCRELMDDAIEDLRKTRDKFKGFLFTRLSDFVEDLTVWLSGSITYQQTCIDGFEGIDSEAAVIMERIMRKAQHLTSNGLAIASNLDNLFKAFRIPFPFLKRSDSSKNQPSDSSTSQALDSSTNQRSNSSKNQRSDSSTSQPSDSSMNQRSDSSKNQPSDSSTSQRSDSSTSQPSDYSMNRPSDSSKNQQLDSSKESSQKVDSPVNQKSSSPDNQQSNSLENQRSNSPENQQSSENRKSDNIENQPSDSSNNRPLDSSANPPPKPASSGNGLLDPLRNLNPLRHLSEEDIDFPRWVKKPSRRLLARGRKRINANVVVAKDGKVKTIAQALAMVPMKNTKKFVIHIRQGVYREIVEVSKKMQHVMFVGDGPTKTIITGDLAFLPNHVSTYRTPTVAVNGDYFMAKDIGFENTAGAARHQAVALRVSADFAIFFNCHMNGYQDTLYVHTHRQFYRDCRISGTIDFVFGDAKAVFQNCDFVIRRPMDNQQCIVTAQGRKDRRETTGIVIHNSRIFGDATYRPVKAKNRAFLGRPWKEFSRTIIMNTDIDDSIDPEGWLKWNETFALNTLFYSEYRNRGRGSGMARRVKWRGIRRISARGASEFAPGNFLRGNTWIPQMRVPYNAN
ncbi:unnamed protein product [Cochlearia groenlandica]